MNSVSRFTRSRPRLVLTFALGAAVALLLPGQWRLVTRALIGWNVAVWLYLCVMGWVMARATHQKVREIAEREQEGAVAVLAILSIAATVSLVAIVVELAALKSAPQSERLIHYGITAATVLGSWLLVGVIYTFHYARAFYRSPSHDRALRFPGDEPDPDYWDFLYFAFTIAVAAQTSDVSIMTRELRKTALAQSILSFIFNAAILGLSINIAASAVGS